MNKNNEAAESAMSDRIASNDQGNNETRGINEREEGTKRTFGVATLWAIRRAGRVFRIHNRLSRI